MLATQSPGEINEPRKRQRKSSHGFPGVRAGQGRGRDKYQACLPYKEETGDLFDTPEEAAADYLRLLKKREAKREAKVMLPDFSRTQLQPASYVSPLPTLARMPMAMPRVGIGRSMWPLPVGSNPNAHGCEVVVAQPLPA